MTKAHTQKPNKVPRNKWKNELHPNEEGFKIVADVFKIKIDEIV